MRLYYIAEAEGRHRHVRSALGVNAERWNDVFREVRDWRLRLRDRYGIAPGVELQPCHVLTLRERLDGDGGGGAGAAPHEGAEILRSGLRLLEDAAHGGGVEVINVCLPTTKHGRSGEVGLGRLLTRINTSATAAGGFLRPLPHIEPGRPIRAGLPRTVGFLRPFPDEERGRPIRARGLGAGRELADGDRGGAVGAGLGTGRRVSVRVVVAGGFGRWFRCGFGRWFRFRCGFSRRFRCGHPPSGRDPPSRHPRACSRSG